MMIIDEGLCDDCLRSTSGRCVLHTPSVTITPATTITYPTVTLTSFPLVPQGWQCPCCRTVYAPHVPSCGCSHAVSVYTTSTSSLAVG